MDASDCDMTGAANSPSDLLAEPERMLLRHEKILFFRKKRDYGDWHWPLKRSRQGPCYSMVRAKIGCTNREHDMRKIISRLPAPRHLLGEATDAFLAVLDGRMLTDLLAGHRGLCALSTRRRTSAQATVPQREEGLDGRR